MWLWVACAVVAVVGMVVAYRLVEPAPPAAVRIAAGPAGGMYAATAEAYRAVFAENGVELRVVETAGSVENYATLLAGDADLAIVQGGTLPIDEGELRRTEAELRSIGSIYLEPLFVFVAGDLIDADDPAALDGRRVAVGPPGSGTRRLATLLIDRLNIEVEAVDVPTAEAAGLLKRGELDAMFAVIAADAPLVRGLLEAPGVRAMSMRRATGVSRQVAYLESVVLPEGSVDLAANLPANDVATVAPAAVLVARADAHSAAVLLAATAANRVHRGGTPLTPPGAFPSDRYAELPVSETAAHYFKSGPSFLRRSLPFWVSSFVERAVIVAVPLLALLIPLIRVAPPVYRWRVRSRIYKWYRVLRDVDAHASPATPPGQLRAQRRRLDELEGEVQTVTVPLSYMEEFYNLRLHLGYLRRRLDALLDDAPPASR